MRNIVTMRKGDKFADIFNSPETIAQAQKDGYHLCTDEEVKALEMLREADAKKQAENNPNNELDIVSRNDSAKTGKSLSEMNKDELLKFSDQKKIYHMSFKELEPDALIQKIIETIKAKVVEAGLKTADEVNSLAENDLLTVFDTIAK